ncbi:Antitoxin Phd_YefM, type II toxin-antitoxin system [Ectothiorhodospira magna]|uniref:Antitoxin n=1 Tax=Ectothiorhodospira magna TaxID=867345 RepID=A0A1H8ZQ42_9GAMM|nr:Antitoxin Phd_YefM, type II toxin-antitoxin system [Ectothiorhodospira magna]
MGKRNKAVLVSEEDWSAIQETLYLLSVPGMRESIREGMDTPVDGCDEVPALIHECSPCSLAEVWFDEDDGNIYLNLNRVATEEDLENDSYLECEGQTIETVQIQVAFCPYCGEKLSVGKEIVVPNFQHYNFGRKK